MGSHIAVRYVTYYYRPLLLPVRYSVTQLICLVCMIVLILWITCMNAERV